MNLPRKTAVPATRSSATVLTARRRVVVFLLVAIMASGVAALILAVQANRRPMPASPGVDPRPAAVAEQAGRDFLAGRNSTVPAARGVDTDFSGAPTPVATETQALTSAQVDTILNGTSKLTVSSFSLQGDTVQKLGDKANRVVHLVRFRVVINSAPYLLSVPILDDRTFGSVLAGTPALLPATKGKREVAAADYTEGYTQTSTSVPDAVASSVEKWVAAYTTGGTNSDALRTATDDKDKGRRYDGLGLPKAGELQQIVNSVPVGGAETGKPAGLIVQVRVGLPLPAANGLTLSSTYDLYVVTEGDPAQPPVVAWGPAGSATELTPYLSNAN